MPQGGADDVPGLDENDDGNSGYAAAYAQLHFASAAEADPYAGEAVPSFLMGSLSRLHASSPGALPPIVSQIVAALPPDKAAAVQGMLAGLL